MVTEKYVSEETALLLREKGFDGECHLSKQVKETHWEESGEWKSETEFTLNIPTLAVAWDWMMEEYGLYLVAFHTERSDWWGNITYMGNSYLAQKMGGHYKKLEELQEEALKFAIENLI